MNWPRAGEESRLVVGVGGDVGSKRQSFRGDGKDVESSRGQQTRQQARSENVGMWRPLDFMNGPIGGMGVGGRPGAVLWWWSAVSVVARIAQVLGAGLGRKGGHAGAGRRVGTGGR